MKNPSAFKFSSRILTDTYSTKPFLNVQKQGGLHCSRVFLQLVGVFFFMAGYLKDTGTPLNCTEATLFEERCNIWSSPQPTCTKGTLLHGAF